MENIIATYTHVPNKVLCLSSTIVLNTTYPQALHKLLLTIETDKLQTELEPLVLSD